MDENLGITINSLVKLLVRNFRIFNVDLVGHDKAGLGLARNDQISQVPVVRLDVALAAADGEAL